MSELFVMPFIFYLYYKLWFKFIKINQPIEFVQYLELNKN